MYEITFGIVLGVALGFHLGYISREIYQTVRFLKDSINKDGTPSVISPSPEVERYSRKESPFIAEPKSPQLIEAEEMEALRKMNPGKF